MSGARYGRLATGSRIGAYAVRSFLGRGATASVYECVHSVLGRVVAVKLLHPHLAYNETALKRFLREGRALSRIHHPNVIEVHDVGEHEGAGFLVMSLAEGEDLSEHLRRHRPMALADIADVMLPVIGAVAAAHDAGVVHRDLKPSNIRMTRDGRGAYIPKVLDFGISKLVKDDPNGDLTESESVLGTTHYMAPEQLRSARDVDARSDVYSLGVILYECATNRRPFAGDNAYGRMHAILTAPVPSPLRWRADLPAAFEAIVLRAMQRRPSDRFASARALGQALAPFASEPDRWRDAFRAGSAQEVPYAQAATESIENSFTLASESPRPRRTPRFRRAGPLAAIAACVLIVRVGLSSPSPSPSSAIVPAQAPAIRAGSAGPQPPLPVTDLQPAPFLLRSPPAPQGSSTPAAMIPSRQVAKRPKVATPPPEPTEEMGPNDAPILE